MSLSFRGSERETVSKIAGHAAAPVKREPLQIHLSDEKFIRSLLWFIRPLKKQLPTSV